MKKKLFNGFILAAVCFGSLGIQKNLMSSNSSLSGLMLENVEALTSPEVVITCGRTGTYGKCWREDVVWSAYGNSEIVDYVCNFSGYEKDHCIPPQY